MCKLYADVSLLAYLEGEQFFVGVHGTSDGRFPGRGHAPLGSVSHGRGGHLVQGDIRPVVLHDKKKKTCKRLVRGM